MEKIIQNQPNDTVVILCRVKEVDKNLNHYVACPETVMIGRLADEDTFIPETTTEEVTGPITSINRVEVNNIDSNRLYFLNPKDFKELKKKFRSLSSDNLLAIEYFKEIREKFYPMFSDGSNYLVVDQFAKRDLNAARAVDDKYERKFYTETITEKNSKAQSKKDNNELASIKRADLSKYLRERILDNDSILDDIATAIVSNFRQNNPKLIRNLLVVGPTGSGKTETFKLIAQYANISVTIYDCNDLTAAGYVGKSKDDIFKHIYSACDGDLARAERSILVLDEFDKLAMKGNEVKDDLVQAALLKIVEGSDYDFELKSNGQKTINTSLMTKVGAGAFMELFDKNKQKHALGFNQKDEDLAMKKLTKTDIIKYGFKPELIGRFKKPITYKPLDREGFIRVLKTAKDNAVALEQAYYQEQYGCYIEACEDYLAAVVDAALSSESGARGISEVVSDSLIKLEAAMMDELDAGHKLPKTLKITGDLVKDPTKFNL